MFHPGERIAERFEVEALLGEGGLAQVYRVRHTALGTTHALKLLTMSHQSLVERLLQEGRIQAQLRHPNIIGVSDVITVRGMPGLLLEYVDCETLETRLGRGQLPLDEALDLFAAVLSGVATAHQAGVMHRDLKPANILLARTPQGVVPKVSDFGIAKIAAGDHAPGLTRAGSAMGTPGYVAPEQMEDASNVDQRADIFSLGTILYELVTGKRAFPSKSMRETLNAAASGQYTPPEELVPELPASVHAAIRKALAPEPPDRFADCVAFAEVLYADQPARLAVVMERYGTPTPAPATLWGRSSSWTPTPSGATRAAETLAPESARSSETLAPRTEGAASRAGLLSRLPKPPPLARALLTIGLGGLALIGLLSLGLLLGRLIRGAGEGSEGQAASEPAPSATSAATGPSAEAPTTPPADAPSAPPAEAAPSEATATVEAKPAASAAKPASSAAKPSSSAAKPAAGAATTSSAGEAAASEDAPSTDEGEPAAEEAQAEEEGATAGPADLPRLVGTWSGDPWRITLLDQSETEVGGYIYRGSTGTRIEVEGRYNPATGTLTLEDQGPARWRLTGTIAGRWYRGTYTQGQGEINTPFSARKTR